MKPRRNRFLVSIASGFLFVPTAFALDGTWINTAGGSWSTANPNWAGDQIADGTGFTADFSTLDVTADATITLDGSRTIGNLVFGDTQTGSAARWTVADGTGGPLILDGATPTITVNPLGAGKNATITATLDGTGGFTKTGAGTLVLNNNTNTISGPVILTEGLLSVQSKPLTGASSVAIQGGTLVVATITGNAIGSNNDTKISFEGGTLQYNVDTPSTDYSARFSTDPGQDYRINVISAAGQPKVVTFSSVLASEGGALTKISTGTLVLAAANTFSGTTTVTAGTLELSHAQALQNSALDTAASALGTATSGIVLTGVTSPTFGGLTGGKALASLFDSDSGNYGSVTNLTLNPGTGADHSYSGGIADGASGMTLTKTGDGSQTLSAASTYSGGTILGAGTLNFANANGLGDGAVSFTGNSTLQAGVSDTLDNDVSVASGVTATVDTNANDVTLGGILTGDGSLTKAGFGTLIISGGAGDNTLSGAIHVDAGTLSIDGITPNPGIQSFANMNGDVTVADGASFNFSQSFQPEELDNDIHLSGAGSGGLGALNLWRNATATGTITLDADATISHNFNRGIINGTITGANRNLTLTTLVIGQPGLEINGPIQLGTGGITVNGVENSFGAEDFSIKLSGNNSYSGETHVVTGKLKLTGDARLHDSSTVRIEAGAVLQLDFAGTDTVAALVLGVSSMPEGTYGSLTSTADNKSADFEGDGILHVGAATDNYDSWAGSQIPPVTGGPDGDDDNDGVKNLVEYALVDGGERGSFSGNTITFTKRGAPYGGDLGYEIEVSTDLGDSDDWETAASGVTEDATSISYQFTPGSPAKNFARLKVVRTP
ncbi:MAG: autotransporter-associated beta strand repeat-containing protein [Akkermansiaceae bacterium]|nr:autotransporter-associated beta strand repeat-containing protein [Akkermansiaceae bacterium]MCP5546920.1 autotransporter-associated beta strand repeat-containing protein [Akkermansiaceae bacterium]